MRLIREVALFNLCTSVLELCLLLVVLVIPSTLISLCCVHSEAFVVLKVLVAFTEFCLGFHKDEPCCSFHGCSFRKMSTDHPANKSDAWGQRTPLQGAIASGKFGKQTLSILHSSCCVPYLPNKAIVMEVGKPIFDESLRCCWHSSCQTPAFSLR